MSEPPELPALPSPEPPLPETEAAYIEEVLGKNGLLARSWPDFRWREGQTMGAYPIDGAIRSRTRIMIEAPTGTGKTLMYLVPAIYHAVRHGRRVLVVTANLTLQRQLIEKDLPRLFSILPWKFRYAELKGRQNFICRKRAADERYEPTRWETEEEKEQVRNLLAWEAKDKAGDKQRLSFSIFNKVDKRLFVRSEDCERDRCRFHGKDDERERDLPRCFAENARADAMVAQIVVTNYAMLCLHLRGYAAVLPPFDIAILDEAHVAADVARERFGFDLRPGVFPHAVGLLRKLAESGDEFEDNETIEIPGDPPASEEDTVERDFYELLGVTRNASAEDIRKAFKREALRVHPDRNPDDPEAEAAFKKVNEAHQVLSDDEKRAFYDRFGPAGNEPAVEDIDSAALAKDILDLGQKFFLRLGDLREMAPIALPNTDFVEHWVELVKLLQRAARVYDSKAARFDSNGPRGRAMAKRCDKGRDSCLVLAARIEAAMTLAAPDRYVYFVAEDEEQRITLSQRALMVGDIFRQSLFTDDRTVIMTSATLRTNGSFRHICREFGLEESETTAFFLSTPFNMAEQTRLIVPAPDNTKMPSPTEKGFDETVVKMLRHAIRLARGRTMALFTSRRRLRYVASHLGDVGYRVLVQGQMERGALLAEFQRDISSVLLATGSFWAGVDVPGEALSCLVIDKLPFEADDPLSQAIKAELHKRNLNPFQHWVIPRAILTLKQGLGRLIRKTDDRGVMMVLDNRLTRKSYGGQFLRSLDLPPECIGYRSEIIAEFLGTALDPEKATEPAGD